MSTELQILENAISDLEKLYVGIKDVVKTAEEAHEINSHIGELKAVLEAIVLIAREIVNLTTSIEHFASLIPISNILNIQIAKEIAFISHLNKKVVSIFHAIAAECDCLPHGAITDKVYGDIARIFHGDFSSKSHIWKDILKDVVKGVKNVGLLVHTIQTSVAKSKETPESSKGSIKPLTGQEPTDEQLHDNTKKILDPVKGIDNSDVKDMLSSLALIAQGVKDIVDGAENFESALTNIVHSIEDVKNYAVGFTKILIRAKIVAATLERIFDDLVAPLFGSKGSIAALEEHKKLIHHLKTDGDPLYANHSSVLDEFKGLNYASFYHEGKRAIKHIEDFVKAQSTIHSYFNIFEKYLDKLKDEATITKQTQLFVHHGVNDDTIHELVKVHKPDVTPEEVKTKIEGVKKLKNVKCTAK